MAAADQSDDFIRDQGLPFLAHLLRRISDRMVEDTGEFERGIGIIAPPRTASTMELLRQRGPHSVTEIADAVRQSHPLVISWIGQLETLGLVSRSADPKDGRRTLIALTRKGAREAERMAAASEIIGRAYARILANADAPVHDALWRVYDLLSRGQLAEDLAANRAAAR